MDERALYLTVDI